LSNFFQERNLIQEEFIPIDVTRESRLPPKKSRGRPRKYPLGIKTQDQGQNSPEVEEINSSDPLEQDIQANVQSSDKIGRGPYHKLTFQNKFEILKSFETFKIARPKVKGKDISYNEFCLNLSTKYKFKISTIKSCILSYVKTPSILIQLEIICENEKNKRKSGQIITRSPRLTYGNEIDQQLCDWVLCNIELGYLITREILKDKAIEMKRHENKEFKASDCWIDCFLKKTSSIIKKFK